ncbi:MAG: helix-turn-helix domain-containing protein [Erysipelotrichaceae bacterium]|nr:helix-turn-helix domain-containing protein [Erysipelotrichaceae bacterium]
MKIEKNRHLMILDGLMKADSEITAEKLADISDSSIRTVKQDIIYLNESLKKENIARISSLKAKGYVLEPLDEEKFAKLQEDVLIMLRMYYNRPIETMDRRLYIIHSFLAQDEVSLEQICEKLYLSESSVRKEIEWVRSFLASYELSIRMNGHNYYVSGKEADLRNVMVEIHCSQYHEFQQTYLHEGFNVMFYQDKNVYEDIRHAFLDILRSSEIAVSDIAAKKIPTYICLLKSRLEKGKLIEIDDEVAQELRGTYDYEIAKKISEHPSIRNHYPLPEIEIVQLAAVILSNRDINIRTRGIVGLEKSHISNNARINYEVMDLVKNRLGDSLYNAEFYHFYAIDMISLQLQLYLRYRFDSLKKDRLVTYIEGDEAQISPVPMEMARIMIAALQKKFNEPIRDPVSIAYAQLLEKMLKKVSYPYHKLRLLACSTEGLVYTQNMIESLLTRQQRYIEKADAYNLYEMRKLDFSEYDMVIHSGSLMYYRYPLRTVSLRETDYQETSTRLFESLFKYGYDRSRPQQLKQILSVHTDTEVGDVDSFIEKMCFRYGKDYDSQIRLYEEYKDKKQIIDCYSSRVHSYLVFFDYDLCDKEFIDIYVPENEATYNDSLRVHHVIIACLDPKNPVSFLKIDNHIIQFFIQVEDSIEQVIEDKDAAIDEMYDRIIETNFFGY